MTAPQKSGCLRLSSAAALLVSLPPCFLPCVLPVTPAEGVSAAFHEMFSVIQLSLISPPDQMISKPGVTAMAVCRPRALLLLLRGVP